MREAAGNWAEAGPRPHAQGRGHDTDRRGGPTPKPPEALGGYRDNRDNNTHTADQGRHAGRSGPPRTEKERGAGTA